MIETTDRRHGFTLIELMIVVVIVGILSAIAIPKFGTASQSARRNACRSNMRTIAAQNTIFHAGNGHYSPSATSLGMAGVFCPEVLSGYDMNGTVSTFHISCPFDAAPGTGHHGNITNGVASWSTAL